MVSNVSQNHAVIIINNHQEHYFVVVAEPLRNPTRYISCMEPSSEGLPCIWMGSLSRPPRPQDIQMSYHLASRFIKNIVVGIFVDHKSWLVIRVSPKGTAQSAAEHETNCHKAGIEPRQLLSPNLPITPWQGAQLAMRLMITHHSCVCIANAYSSK